MALETFPWSTVDHLDSEEMILGYLEAVFEDGDPALIAAALNDVAQARGVAGGKMLAADTALDSVIRTMKSLGLELTAKAA